MKSQKIIIAGAGIGGLAAASCLMKAGHRVEIYEQAPQLGEIGAGIQISANAMHVMRYIGVGEQIDKIGVRPEAYVFRLHDTGEVIQRFSLSAEHERMHGAPYTQLHRADLHELLAAKAREFDPNIVRLNKRATKFTQDDKGVTLHFADGTSATGDVLIGADGLKSVVRAQIVGVRGSDAATEILGKVLEVAPVGFERVRRSSTLGGQHVEIKLDQAAVVLFGLYLPRSRHITPHCGRLIRPRIEVRQSIRNVETALPVLVQRALRDNHRDLARRGIGEIRQSKDGPVSEADDDPDKHEKPEQAGHWKRSKPLVFRRRLLFRRGGLCRRGFSIEL